MNLRSRRKGFFYTFSASGRQPGQDGAKYLKALCGLATQSPQRQDIASSRAALFAMTGARRGVSIARCPRVCFRRMQIREAERSSVQPTYSLGVKDDSHHDQHRNRQKNKRAASLKIASHDHAPMIPTNRNVTGKRGTPKAAAGWVDRGKILRHFAHMVAGLDFAGAQSELRLLSAPCGSTAMNSFSSVRIPLFWCLLLFTNQASLVAATPYPTVGDTFAGTFSIDADAPLNPSYPYPVFYYESSGTFDLTNYSALGSGHSQAVVVSPGSDGEVRWGLIANFGNFDNFPDGPWIAAFQLRLYGSTASSSIFPLEFTDYAGGAVRIGLIEDAEIFFLDGILATLANVDGAGTFAFSATITDRTLVGALDTLATPIPATLPLFATGLSVLGFLARRRKRAAAIF